MRPRRVARPTTGLTWEGGIVPHQAKASNVEKPPSCVGAPPRPLGLALHRSATEAANANADQGTWSYDSLSDPPIKDAYACAKVVDM